MKLKLSFAIVAIAATYLAFSYLKPSPINEDSAIFKSFPTEITQEVLQNLKAISNTGGLKREDQEILWQGQIINFQMCRQMLNVYQSWISAGTPPDSLPSIQNGAFNSTVFVNMSSMYDYYNKIAESGSIDDFREALTADGSCGVWIPAKPNDVNGPSIADVVNSLD